MSLSDLKPVGRHGDSRAGDGRMPCTFGFISLEPMTEVATVAATSRSNAAHAQLGAEVEM